MISFVYKLVIIVFNCSIVMQRQAVVVLVVQLLVYIVILCVYAVLYERLIVVCPTVEDLWLISQVS